MKIGEMDCGAAFATRTASYLNLLNLPRGASRGEFFALGDGNLKERFRGHIVSRTRMSRIWAN